MIGVEGDRCRVRNVESLVQYFQPICTYYVFKYTTFINRFRRLLHVIIWEALYMYRAHSKRARIFHICALIKYFWDKTSSFCKRNNFRNTLTVLQSPKLQSISNRMQLCKLSWEILLRATQRPFTAQFLLNVSFRYLLCSSNCRYIATPIWIIIEVKKFQ